MKEMPSIVSQRKKVDTCNSQPVLIVQDKSNDIVTAPAVCDGSKPSLSKVTSDSTPDSRQKPSTSYMASITNPIYSQGHPIDELTSEPVDVRGRSSQLPTESNNSSTNSSTDFGPFVSGIAEEPRPRSSSFNSNILRQPQKAVHQHMPSDPLRRFSETHSLKKTGSADNVAAHPPHHPQQLRHSHTVPEIPPLALSNDSGYHTPPNCRQQQPMPAHNTSPPWPPNRHAPWPSHVSPPAQTVFPTGHDHMTTPAALRPLTIETGHYQPEPSPSPQLMVGSVPAYMPMHQPIGYNYQRSHDQYGSLQSQGSATPEEGM